MKKQILFAMFISINILAFCQERQNRENTSFLYKSADLTYAKGWSFDNYTGIWVDNDNLISSNKCINCDKDFIKIKTGSILKEGERFYIMLFYIGKNEIRQEYDTIRKTVNYNENFIDCILEHNKKYLNQNIAFFIFNSQEYARLKNAVNQQLGKNEVFYPAVATGYYQTKSTFVKDSVKRIEVESVLVFRQIDTHYDPFYYNSHRYNNLYPYNKNSEEDYDDFYKSISYSEKPYNELELLGEINRKLASNNQSKLVIWVNSQILNGQSIVRFSMPKSRSNSESDFKNNYFEVSKTEFQKLLID